MNQGEIRIILRADDNMTGPLQEVSSAVNTLKNYFNELQAKATPLASKLLNLAESAGEFGDKIDTAFHAASVRILDLEKQVIGFSHTFRKLADDIDNSVRAIANNTGTTLKEATKLNETAKAAYINNLVSTVKEGGIVVSDAARNFSAATDEQLNDIVMRSLKIQKLGIDYADSLDASASLVNNFGISHKTAFDFIAKGIQDGVNGSKDLVDSIQEYSLQFSESGFAVEQFFSLMKTGNVGGILGTDKIADAVKEFKIRFLESTEDTSKDLSKFQVKNGKITGKVNQNTKSMAEAFKSLGLNHKKMLRDVNAGVMTLADAWSIYITKLAGVKEKTEQFTLGQTAMGSQFEDLGIAAFKNIDLTDTSLNDITGTVNNLVAPTASLEIAWLKAWRAISVSVADATPFAELTYNLRQLLDNIKKNFSEALSRVNLDPLLNQLEIGKQHVNNLFDAMFSSIDLNTVDGLQEALQRVVHGLTVLQAWINAMIPYLQPFVDFFTRATEAVYFLDEETSAFIGDMAAGGYTVKQFGDVADYSFKMLNDAAITAKSAIDVLFGSIRMLLGGAHALVSIFTILGNSIAGAFAFVAQAVLNSVRKILNAASIITPDALGGDHFREWGNSVEEIMMGVDDFIAERADSINKSFDALKNNDTGLNGFRQLMRGIDGGADDVLGNITGTTEEAAEKARKNTETTGNAMKSVAEATARLMQNFTVSLAAESNKIRKTLEGGSNNNARLKAVEDTIKLEQRRVNRTYELLRTEAQMKASVAKATIEDEKQLSEEQAKIFKDLANKRVTATEKSFNTLKTQMDKSRAAYENYTGQVLRLQDAITKEEQRQKKEREKFRFAGLSKPEQFREIEDNYTELGRKFTDAFDAGDISKAEELARQQEALAKSQRELADGGIERRLADDNIRLAQEKILEVLRSQKTEAEQARDAQKNQVEILQDAADKLKSKLIELQDAAKLSLNLDSIDLDVKLAELADTQTLHEVVIFYKEGNSPPALASGGTVSSYASGGYVLGPGTETSDSILARLSRNEFVQPALAVRHYGLEFMEAIRTRRYDPAAMLNAMLQRMAAYIPPSPSVPQMHGRGADDMMESLAVVLQQQVQMPKLAPVHINGERVSGLWAEHKEAQVIQRHLKKHLK